MKLFFLLLSCLFFFSNIGVNIAVNTAMAKENPAPILVLTMDGAVGPAFTDYLKRGIEKAEESAAQLLVIELDTPGGLLTSTREMASLIVESPVSIAVYVTPSGAHAASAGTFILYAAHIAAMDESTNIGAAIPVDVQPGGGSPQPPAEPQKQPENDAENKNAHDEEEELSSNEENIQKKALEDTLAFIRGLAELRDRNPDFAREAVKEGKSLTAKEALEQNVIEYLAPTRDSLIEQINGKEITLDGGRKITIQTEGAEVVELKPGLRTQLLSIITDPNIAVILMSIGIYGLILEFYNPGTMIPGAIGAICLITAFFALNILPINAAGLAFMALGLAFIVAEAFMPSFGVMGIVGVAALVFGSTILFDSGSLLGIGLNAGVIWGIAVFGLGLVALIVWLTIYVYKKQNTTGTEAMLGKKAKIVEWKGKEGRVLIEGETWKAFSDENLSVKKNDTVFVSRVLEEEITLKIRTTNF